MYPLSTLILALVVYHHNVVVYGEYIIFFYICTLEQLELIVLTLCYNLTWQPWKCSIFFFQTPTAISITEFVKVSSGYADFFHV